MLKNVSQAGIQKSEKSSKRTVYAPRPERGTEPPAVVAHSRCRAPHRVRGRSRRGAPRPQLRWARGHGRGGQDLRAHLLAGVPGHRNDASAT
jgi:hypothetical protein